MLSQAVACWSGEALAQRGTLWMPHPWRCTRPGWIEFRAAWSGGKKDHLHYKENDQFWSKLASRMSICCIFLKLFFTGQHVYLEKKKLLNQPQIWSLELLLAQLLHLLANSISVQHNVWPSKEKLGWGNEVGNTAHYPCKLLLRLRSTWRNCIGEYY